VPATPTAATLNRLTSSIIEAAIRVHRNLGPGLLEGVYVSCLSYELHAAGVLFELQKGIPLVYEGVRMDCAYRADLVVDRSVLVEVKAVESLAPIHGRQLYTYLRLGDFRVGLVLNFGSLTMKDGIKRVVNDFPRL
jgi:GxxExxY protein